MRGVVGSRCTLRASLWEAEEEPVVGDFLRTTRGSCYRIEEVLPGRPGSQTVYVLRCTRLDRDAVAFGEPGVFGWSWARRRPAEVGLVEAA